MDQAESGSKVKKYWVTVTTKRSYIIYDEDKKKAIDQVWEIANDPSNNRGAHTISAEATEFENVVEFQRAGMVPKPAK